MSHPLLRRVAGISHAQRGQETPPNMRDDRNTPRKRSLAWVVEEQRSDRALVDVSPGHRWASPEARAAARKDWGASRAVTTRLGN